MKKMSIITLLKLTSKLLEQIIEKILIKNLTEVNQLTVGMDYGKNIGYQFTEVSLLTISIDN